MLTKGVSAEVQITLRNLQVSGVSQVARGIPVEPFSMNKDMGRILIRRGGETIAAGISTLQVSRRWLIIYLHRSSLGNHHVKFR